MSPLIPSNSKYVSKAAADMMKSVRQKAAYLRLEVSSKERTSPPELTSLHEAIEARDLKRVNQILRKGNVDLNELHSNYDWGFPLGHAYDVDDRRIVRALLKAGANPNVVDAMPFCIEQNDLPLAKLLIEFGVDLEGQPTWEKDEKIETNLIKATRLERYALVKLLLEAGADPNCHDGNIESALLVARKSKNKRLIKLLEKYVSDEERAWVDDVLSEVYAEQLCLDKKIWIAIHSGEEGRVLDLLTSSGRPLDKPLEPNHGCILEEALHAYGTALSYTRPTRGTTDGKDYCTENQPNFAHPNVVKRRSLVDALLEMGAPSDKGGWTTPLAYLSQLSDKDSELELGLKLIESATEVDAPINGDGESALMSAVSGFRSYAPLLVDALLKRGANPNARNCHGVSVLQRARSHEEFHGPNPCVPLLLEAGAKE